MFYLLWLSGIAAFGAGVRLAQISGYPVLVIPTLLAGLVVLGVQYALIWRLHWGRDLIGALGLGFVPAYLGFFLQSRHWASELLVLGALLSLAAGKALLAQRWHQEWALRATGATDQYLGAAPRGLAFTLINIVLIGGLLVIWYLPASPLPGRDGAWVLVAAAVLNQELIKRQYYASWRGSTILAWMATAFEVGLSLWLLAVLYVRGLG